MQTLLRSPMGRFRLLALAEGVSFLIILFITMPLKYLWQMPQPNLVFGSLHGLLFVLYVGGVLYLRGEQGWNIRTTALALAASVVPFGTFWADRHLFRS